MIDLNEDYANWKGKREEQLDSVTIGHFQRFAATFNHPNLAVDEGDELPPLAHWTLFLPTVRQSELGEDGHARLGGFLPPVHHLPRRMWAGGRLHFSQPLRIGMSLSRVSQILDIKLREGSLGPLVFVTVLHEIREKGKDDVLLREEHDIVYRSADSVAAKPAPQAPAEADWSRSLDPDDTLLFRYSALTFNAYRIHYDRRYATQQQGYPGLVVHAPLTATLLAGLVRTELPGASLRSFSFRAISPLFDGSTIHLYGNRPDGDGLIRLWATNAEQGLAMQAEARLS